VDFPRLEQKGYEPGPFIHTLGSLWGRHKIAKLGTLVKEVYKSEPEGTALGLARGEIAVRRAMPCVGLVALDELLDELKPLDIHWNVTRSG
jgi:hypothetical protein